MDLHEERLYAQKLRDAIVTRFKHPNYGTIGTEMIQVATEWRDAISKDPVSPRELISIRDKARMIPNPDIGFFSLANRMDSVVKELTRPLGSEEAEQQR
jgi:hypothetical protein